MYKTDMQQWVRNDFTDVLGEYGEYAGAFLTLYAETFSHVTGRMIPRGMYEASVARDGEVYVTQPAVMEFFRLRLGDVIRFWWHVTKERHDDSPVNLMTRSIFLSLLYRRVPIRYIFKRREELTQKISNVLIDSRQNFMIKEIDVRSRREEIIVVPGNILETGPFYDMTGQDSEVPDGVVVRCDQLYPTLKNILPRISGIICYNGSQLSHIATIAREMKLPMKIHATKENNN